MSTSGRGVATTREHHRAADARVFEVGFPELRALDHPVQQGHQERSAARERDLRELGQHFERGRALALRGREVLVLEEALQPLGARGRRVGATPRRLWIVFPRRRVRGVRRVVPARRRRRRARLRRAVPPRPPLCDLLLVAVVRRDDVVAGGEDNGRAAARWRRDDGPAARWRRDDGPAARRAPPRCRRESERAG